jgi:iron complex outermembrane receptor protein
MGSFDYRNQHVLEAAQRSFSKTGVIRGDVTVRHQRHQLPGRPERLRADAAELQPAGSIPNRPAPPAATTSRATSTSFRRTSRHHPGQGQLRDHADHIGSIEYLHREEPATSRVAPAPTST